MAVDEVVHVAIAPPDKVEANLIKEVAAIVKKDLYETRLMLIGKIPKIVASYTTLQMAESAASSLKALGLMAFVCENSKLRKPIHCFKAHTLKFGQKELVFRDNAGQSIKIESRNIFLILKGRIQSYTEKGVTTTRTKLNLPVTILTGGIPVRQKVTEKTGETFVRAECFLRLYDRESLDPRVEILEYNLDYSFLEEEKDPFSVTNFNTVVKKIRDIVPRAAFDDRLTEPHEANLPFVTPKDNIEINCKLIYLYHLATGDLKSLA
jgi:hypothetical protein